MGSGAVVVVEQLTKRYGDHPAVDGIDLEVRRGEVFALLGPNGAGKTTAIEMLEGFRKRDQGHVQVLGMDPEERATQQALRQRIGVVLQDLAVEPFLTVREVLTRSAGYFPAPRPVDDAIAAVGLEEKADVRVKNFSGGQQRRLDLALGVIGNPDLIFLDEPTTGFDPTARRGAWELVRSLARGGTTVILTTHYMDEAEALADRLAVIVRGRIVAAGTPQSIGDRERSEATLSFGLTDPGRLPPALAALARVGSGRVEISTRDEVAVLHDLTGWALAEQIRLPGLTLSRPSLEDVYLRLTELEPNGAQRADATPGVRL